VSGQRQASAVDEEEASANQQMVYSGKQNGRRGKDRADEGETQSINMEAGYYTPITYPLTTHRRTIRKTDIRTDRHTDDTQMDTQTDLCDTHDMHTQTSARAHAHKRAHAQALFTLTSYTHTQTRAHTHTKLTTHTRARARAHTHAHTLCTRTHASNTHLCTSECAFSEPPHPPFPSSPPASFHRVQWTQRR